MRQSSAAFPRVAAASRRPWRRAREGGAGLASRLWRSQVGTVRVLLICLCIGWVCGAAERVATLPSTNEPPALVLARQAIREAIDVRDRARAAYQRTAPPVSDPFRGMSGPGSPKSPSSGLLLRGLAARRYLDLGMADTVGGRMAMGDLALYAGDIALYHAWRKAEREVTRRQAVVVAMLAGIQSASKTNKVVVAISPAEAATVKFLQEQSDTGSLRAKFDLGVRYIDGRGVGKDEAKGWGHIQAAADLGYEPAQARWAAHFKELAGDGGGVTSP